MFSLDYGYLVPAEFHSCYRYPTGTVQANALHLGLLGPRHLYRYRHPRELRPCCYRWANLSKLPGRTRTNQSEVYSAFVDFYLAVYPSVILFRIQMSLRKELAPEVPSGISATWKKVALGVALGIGAR